MKIAIIGFSGSGKSTLARALGTRFHADVLHLDSVHFLPDWRERAPEDEKRIVESFLGAHDAWVIDGNYTKLSYERRMEEADQIVMMLFRRFDCLLRVVKRYRTFRNKTRPDVAEGCQEKLDREFISWVLWKGRRKAAVQRYGSLRERYSAKVIVLRNQKELDAYLREASVRSHTEQGEAAE